MGEDPARLLADRYDVEFFESTAAPPAADAIVVVKVLPSMSFLKRAKVAKSLLLFVPVDGLQDPEHISRARRKLRFFDGVWLHCQRLASFLAPYCAELHGIDHWNRYGLESLPKYRDEGPLLWLGACENLPWLLVWLEEHPLPHPVRLLTNLDNAESREAAQKNAAETGMSLELEPGMRSIGDHECAIWNEDIQREWMQTAKAGLDIKGPTFLQRHKPPTKAQQFIASGIPFAANPDAYAVEYFAALGFEIVAPEATERWLSRSYHEETLAFAIHYAQSLTLEQVAARYAALIEGTRFHPRGRLADWRDRLALAIAWLDSRLPSPAAGR